MNQSKLPIAVELDSCSVRMMMADDAADFMQLVSDALVSKHIEAFREIDDIAKALLLIEKFKLASENGRGAMWGAFEKNNGPFMGVIGTVDLQDDPSIFYALLSEYRHFGVATECVLWLTDYLHQVFCKHLIVTEVYEDNYPSKNVLSRCGYSYDEKNKLYHHIFER